MCGRPGLNVGKETYKTMKTLGDDNDSSSDNGPLITSLIGKPAKRGANICANRLLASKAKVHSTG